MPELGKERSHQLTPGLTDVPDFLKQKHVFYTIATASGKFNVDFYFSHLKIGEYFDIKKVVFDNGKIKGKPNPDIYLKAMEAVNTKPENTIIFEDSYTGIDAAERSGASEIIIVNSSDRSYTDYNHTIIKDFNQVNRDIFFE